MLSCQEVYGTQLAVEPMRSQRQTVGSRRSALPFGNAERAAVVIRAAGHESATGDDKTLQRP